MTVDHDLREAVVGLVGGEVVGVARYDRSPDDPATAEFAILVEDGWQGVGLGRQLLVELIGLAADRGVRTLTATVQRDNDRVIGLIRRLLPGSSFDPDLDVFVVAAPCTPDTRSGPPPEVREDRHVRTPHRSGPPSLDPRAPAGGTSAGPRPRRRTHPGVRARDLALAPTADPTATASSRGTPDAADGHDRRDSVGFIPVAVVPLPRS